MPLDDVLALLRKKSFVLQNSRDLVRLNEIILNLTIIQRRMDDARIRAIMKDRVQDKKQLEQLISWRQYMDESLEAKLTEVVQLELQDATTYDGMRKLYTVAKKNEILVEFDGVVLGTLEGRNVLVLIEAKHNMWLEYIDKEELQKRCGGDEKKMKVKMTKYIPNKVKKYLDALYGGEEPGLSLAERFSKSTSEIAKRDALGQVALASKLTEMVERENVIVAIGGNFVPQEVKNFLFAKSEVKDPIFTPSWWLVEKTDSVYKVSRGKR